MPANDFIAVIRHDNRGIALLEHGINKLASSAKGLVEKMFPDKPSTMNSQEKSSYLNLLRL